MNREQLLASLTETVERDAVIFDKDVYIDWSIKNDDGTTRFTMQDEDGDVTILNLNHEQIVRLQQALTVYVLEA